MVIIGKPLQGTQELIGQIFLAALVEDKINYNLLLKKAFNKIIFWEKFPTKGGVLIDHKDFLEMCLCWNIRKFIKLGGFQEYLTDSV